MPPDYTHTFISQLPPLFCHSSFAGALPNPNFQTGLTVLVLQDGGVISRSWPEPLFPLILVVMGSSVGKKMQTGTGETNDSKHPAGLDLA